MKYLIWFMLGGCFVQVAAAQNDNTFKVPTGADASKVLSFKDRYQYPAFTSGRVYYKDGKGASGKLNYSLLFDEMHFINPSGDTLALDNEAFIQSVIINSDTFYYNKGYMALLTGNHMVKLAKKDFLKRIDKEKIGGYNMPNPSASITNYKSFTADNQVYKLDIREDVLFAKRTVYFFGNQNGEFLLANKKSLLKLFPKYEAALNDYLKQHTVDFMKEDDLRQLASFIQGLY